MVSAEKNPLDGRADFAVDIRMCPLDVVLNVPFFKQCVAFFRIPSSIDLSDMSAATQSSLQQFAIRAKQQLALAWEHSTTLDLHCNMQVSSHPPPPPGPFAHTCVPPIPFKPCGLCPGSMALLFGPPTSNTSSMPRARKNS